MHRLNRLLKVKMWDETLYNQYSNLKTTKHSCNALQKEVTQMCNEKPCPTRKVRFTKPLNFPNIKMIDEIPCD